MSAADKIAAARALIEPLRATVLWGNANPDVMKAAETLDALADLADAQAQEIARLRAENERLQNLDHVCRWNEAFSPTHQHKKRGSTYELLGTARIQSDEPLADMAAVEVYIGREGDLWARRQSEFHDGRFIALGDAP